MAVEIPELTTFPDPLWSRLEQYDTATSKAELFDLLCTVNTGSAAEAEQRREQLTAAFAFADAAFAASPKPFRLTGEETICHSLRIAYSLAAVGITDVTVLQGAILHDVPEDTARTLAEVGERFGSDVALLVDAVSKVKSHQLERAAKEPEGLRDKRNLEKIFRTLQTDHRAIYIKVADVLDNSWTYDVYATDQRNNERGDKQKRKANLALTYYEPLARRMGMHGFARYIGDNALRSVQPGLFREIAEVRERLGIHTLTEQVTEQLQEWVAQSADSAYPLQAERIVVRVPGIYEAYRKTPGRQVAEHWLYPTVHLICDDPVQAAGWEVFLLKHQLLVGNGHDHNVLAELTQGRAVEHTVLIGGKPITICLATEAGVVMPVELDMAGRELQPDVRTAAEAKLASLRQFYEQAVQSSTDIADAMAEGLREGTVTVFTPKGTPQTLRSGATVLDFAYQVGKNLGHAAEHAIVRRSGDKQVVSLDQVILPGDIIEIRTAAVPALIGPHRYDFVTTPKARDDIKQRLKWLEQRGSREALYTAARERGTRILEWLYERRSGKVLDIHLQYGFTRVPFLSTQYRDFDTFRQNLGMIPRPIPVTHAEGEQLYEEWQSWMQSEPGRSHPDVELAERAVAVVDALIAYRQTLPRVVIRIPDDSAGFLTLIAGVLEREQISVLSLHGVPDHYGIGPKPARVEFCLTEGLFIGAAETEYLLEQFATALGPRATVEIIPSEQAKK